MLLKAISKKEAEREEKRRKEKREGKRREEGEGGEEGEEEEGEKRRRRRRRRIKRMADRTKMINNGEWFQHASSLHVFRYLLRTLLIAHGACWALICKNDRTPQNHPFSNCMERCQKHPEDNCKHFCSQPGLVIERIQAVAIGLPLESDQKNMKPHGRQPRSTKDFFIRRKSSDPYQP